MEVNGYKIEPGANLREANLSGVTLKGAKLQEANLSEAKWDESTVWPEGFTPPKK